MIVNILLLVLGYAFYKVFLALYRVKFHPLAKFPGPRAAAISNTWQCESLKRGQSEAELEKLHQEYGTQALRVGPNEIHITDPSLYKTIYNQKSLYLKHDDFYAGFNVLSVFSIINPEQHKERRRLLNPFFSKAGIFKTEALIAEKVSRLKKKIELLTAPGRNHPINGSNAFRCLTIDIITHYAFSQSWMLIDKSDDSFSYPLLTALDAALEGIWDSIYKPILRKLMTAIPSSALSLVYKDVAKFIWLRALGQDSYEAYKNAEKNEEQSIFDALTAAVPGDKHIPDEALGLLVAGSDTTAFTLTFAIWHISQDFRVKQKLMKSLADSLPDREAPATLLQLEAIPYLSACVREALRLGTFSPGKLPRVVPGGSAEPLIVEGKVIPPGTIVSMSAYTLHRNKEVWGDDAGEFNPDRWLGEDGKHLETHLAPFSKGSRACIGQNLAFAELFITLAMLYRHFDIKVDKISENFIALDRFAPSVPEPGVILNMEKLEESKPSTHGKTIAFLHPDLGIGGAERLVVDAAVGLQKRGHKVVIFTSHCDPGHCFDEARDGTLDVRVRGNTVIPPSLLGRFSILCAILRQLHLILQIYFTSELRDLHPDAYFVDQLSAGLPLLQYLHPRARIFFYCHFPDLLLAQGRQKWLKRVYRVPFDFWEQWSMSFADAIAVNSNFTKGVVSQTWPALARQRDLWTVYPCVDTRTKEKNPGEKPLWNGMKFVLSINRFERKKDIALAIKAFAGLSKSKRAGVRLAVAGGYDPRVGENVSYHNELVGLAESLGLKNMTVRTPQTAQAVPQDVEVLFLQNVTNMLKEMLLSSARLLVYTPANEHFGIVPLEAMLAGVPVLATNTGGPVETVVEGQTGWLRSPDKIDEWTAVMDKALHQLSPQDLAKMSEAGIARVKSGFGEAEMAQRLDSIFDEMLRTERPSRGATTTIMLLAGTLGLFTAAAAVSIKVWP